MPLPPIRLFCLTLRWSGARISEVLALTPAAIDIESGVAYIRDSQTPQARRRSAGAAAAGFASRTRSRVQAADRAAGSAACDQAALALEPHDRMAVCEGGHGDGRHYRHARDAEGLAAWLRRERVSSRMCRRISCSAGSATRRFERHLYMATLSAPRSAPLPPACGGAASRHNP